MPPRSISSSVVKRRPLSTYSRPCRRSARRLPFSSRKTNEVLLFHVNLRVITGVGQFAISLQQTAARQLRRGFHRGADGGRGQFAECGQHRIHLQDVESRQQPPQQSPNAWPMVVPARNFLPPGRDFFAERKAAQRARNSPIGGAQCHAADRLPGSRARRISSLWAGVAVEYPGVVDLGEIVILGGQPEDGHRGNAVARTATRQLHRVQHFVNGVRRAGKQPDLLAGDHRHGSGLRQPIERGTRRILHSQRVDSARRAAPAESRILAGRLPEGLEIANGMAIERRGAVRMIQHVREQARSVAAGRYGGRRYSACHVDQLTR